MIIENEQGAWVVIKKYEDNTMMCFNTIWWYYKVLKFVEPYGYIAI